MRYFFLMSVFLKLVTSEEYSQMQAIFIENFDPVDFQENDTDLELLPRVSRTFETDNSKEYFFRFLRSLENNEVQPSEKNRNVPKPGGLRTHKYEENPNHRNKRQTSDAHLNAPTVNFNSKKPSYGLVKSLGKPLELSVLNSENSTAQVEEISSIEAGMTDSTTTVATIVPEEPESKQDKENVLINDFIRFRRSTNNTQLSENINNNTAQNHKNELTYPSNAELFNGHSEKLVMEPIRTDSDRTASKIEYKEWVKQPYPVFRRNDEFLFDDNVPASSEAIRAPRVNFVTQTLSEPHNVPEFRLFEREPRARTLRTPYMRDTRDMRDLEEDFSRPIDYYEPRYTRQYPIARHPDYRDNRYYRYDHYPREIYRPRYQNYEMESATTNYQKPKQKRIIYYATLPDVSRSSQNVDFRDRYGYRERERYEDPYRYRKDYPKSRYTKDDSNKTPYPVKVSTDVNVREVKKNPERRIYSEVDNRRYAYKQDPYQTNTDKF